MMTSSNDSYLDDDSIWQSRVHPQQIVLTLQRSVDIQIKTVLAVVLQQRKQSSYHLQTLTWHVLQSIVVQTWQMLGADWAEAVRLPHARPRTRSARGAKPESQELLRFQVDKLTKCFCHTGRGTINLPVDYQPLKDMDLLLTSIFLGNILFKESNAKGLTWLTQKGKPFSERRRGQLYFAGWIFIFFIQVSAECV